MLELMKVRRSIRRYTEEPIAEDAIQKMVCAALLAPTSKGKKPVEVVLVEDREMLRALSTCKAHSASFLANAALGIVIIADSELTDVWVEDASIAAIAIQLEAEHLGLGSTWIQMRLRQSKDGTCSEQSVRDLLGIPAKYGVLCILALGHKAEEKSPYTDADANMSKVHKGKF